MAISTYGATLKWGESSEAVSKVVDIKEFPDLIGDPNLLETTTLADAAQTYIPGIKSTDNLQFLANYTKTDYKACQQDEGKSLYYSLELSDGSHFDWQGQHVLGLPGKGVDEVMEFTINVVPSTPVAFSDGAGV